MARVFPAATSQVKKNPTWLRGGWVEGRKSAGLAVPGLRMPPLDASAIPTSDNPAAQALWTMLAERALDENEA